MPSPQLGAAKAFRGTVMGSLRPPVSQAQAASQRSLDWANENSALYNEAFVGQAKLIVRCHHCLSDNHKFVPNNVSEFATWPLWPPTHPPPQAFRPYMPQSAEVCRKFNEGRCSFPEYCKYGHSCSGLWSSSLRYLRHHSKFSNTLLVGTMKLVITELQHTALVFCRTVLAVYIYVMSYSQLQSTILADNEAH